MKKHPYISVVMPAYNSETFIAESIQSIVDQTYTNWELLIINDSSTDNTSQIIDTFCQKDPRIKHLKNKYSKGIVGALNTGLDAAQGDFIMRLDSDDIAVPERMQLQLDFLLKRKDIQILGGGYTPFSGAEQHETLMRPKNPILLRLHFCVGSFFCHPSVMFRSFLKLEFKGYPQTIAEDYNFFSQILNKYRGSNLQLELVKYRVHGNNLSLVLKEDNAKDSINISEDNILTLGGKSSWGEDLGKFIRLEKMRKKSALITAIRALKLIWVIRGIYKYHVLHFDYLYSLAYVFKRLTIHIFS